MAYILFAFSVSIGLIELLVSYKSKGKELSIKRISIAPYLLLLTLIILFAGSASNPDTDVYLDMYENTENIFKDYGFGLFIVLLKSLGIGYKGLLVSVAILGLGLMHDVARRYLDNDELILLYIMYLIHPFFYDVIQVRNFLAAALMIYAVHELSKEEIKDTIISFVLIIIAITIHFAAVFYIPFIVLISLVKSNKIREKILYTLSGIAIIFFSNKFLVYKSLDFLLDYILKGKGRQSYFGFRTTSLVGYVFWLFILLNVLLMLMCMQIQRKTKTEDANFKSKFSYIVYLLNFYSILFCPLFLATLDFYRLNRNILFLNYIVILITARKMNRSTCISKKEKIIFTCFVIFLVIFSFSGVYIFCFGHANEFRRIFLPVLNYNWILNPSCQVQFYS